MRHFALVLISLFAILLSPFRVRGQDTPEAFEQRLDQFPVVDEIDTAAVEPVHQFPPSASSTTNLLGKVARILPAGAEPKGMAWVVGRGRNLESGRSYLLSVEYPDDIPRTIFVANRGADLVRGFATGPATGDMRQQYTQPSLESLAYPQSGAWQRHRTLFVLHDRFQGLRAQRDPKPGGRPYVPADGFHVIIFQSHRLNDPRSQGAAVGRIRLHAVPERARLAPAFPDLPPSVPRRHLFFREEMGDEPVSASALLDRACPDPVEWYVAKARVARWLGFNTFTKDLLEFGHNQGWQSGDPAWCVNAQPPLTDLWDRLVPRIANEGMELLPYYEYKGMLGLSTAQPPSLGWQRRAQKLYHGLPNTNYTGVWWVEQHNADLTDPETLKDAQRLLDTTLLKHKDKAPFVGAWFRTRGNHLPISFADAALARFRAARPGDPFAGHATNRAALIASYEGDQKLYHSYLSWWFAERAKFLGALQEHLAGGLQRSNTCVIFTPWPGEPVPLLRDPQSGASGHPVQITTDDVGWWDAFAKSQPDSSWFRWALAPTALEKVVRDDVYRYSLKFREPVAPAPWRSEEFHAAPGADPERYVNAPGVMLTYPIGRMFTAARPELLEQYRSRSGLTVIRHYPLNEDNPEDRTQKGPFGGEVGYLCVDVDRAGPYSVLQEARALAAGDPVNIGYLCASGWSTGFPGWVRRFNQAFLALPALPSQRVAGASSDPEVVVRAIKTADAGTYYMVINTSFQPKARVSVRLPSEGPARDLLARSMASAGVLSLDLYPGEVRPFHSAAR